MNRRSFMTVLATMPCAGVEGTEPDPIFDTYVSGSIYVDTSDGKMFINDGSGWSRLDQDDHPQYPLAGSALSEKIHHWDYSGTADEFVRAWAAGGGVRVNQNQSLQSVSIWLSKAGSVG